MFDFTFGPPLPHANAQDRSCERRRRRRYPIRLALNYTAFLNGALAATGQGHTSNISAGGVLFYPSTLPLHAFTVLTISWPVAAAARPVTLVAAGYVLRSSPRGTAVQITSYEFIFEHRYLMRRPARP